jgi:hypothetical protein
MEKEGFKNYPKEWWHFTLEDEPYPRTYFNFPVTPPDIEEIAEAESNKDKVSTKGSSLSH